MMKIKSLVFVSICAILSASTALGQELNCNVQVIAPRIANVEASVFESLEEGIHEWQKVD